jgi:hypothetical protein
VGGKEQNVALTKTPRKGTAAGTGRIFTGLLVAILLFARAPHFFSCYVSAYAFFATKLCFSQQFWATYPFAVYGQAADLSRFIFYLDFVSSQE